MNFGNAVMTPAVATGAVIFLLILAFFSGCISGPVPNCGDDFCHPPDVCCKGACYRQCPQNTVINPDCACVIETEYSPCRTVENSPTQTGIAAPPGKAKTTQTASPSGLLVWYDFEDDFTRSGIVADRSSSGRDAVVKGMVNTAPGLGGTNAIAFAGRGYIQAPDNPAALRKEITFSFWFNTADPDANYKFAGAAWWQGGPGSGWTMATHVPEFWAEDTKGVLVPAQQNKANNFRAGEWNHEVVTYDGNTIKEYTNGRLINTWVSRGVPMGTGEPMAVGGWPQFQGYNFIGQIDDFRIYDHALDAREITGLYEEWE